MDGKGEHVNVNGNVNGDAAAGGPAMAIPQQQQPPPLRQLEPRVQVAPGLEAVHKACKELYPEQINPLTVTTIVKYWLGGPDPLDYISMYENRGCPEQDVPPHWHYVSLGLSDLHGDARLHPHFEPDSPSGFGFELTFRLLRQPGERSPPTWPANVMQQLAKYVFKSGNLLMPGDHVSWHAPLDGRPDGRITQILMARDAQLPTSLLTPHGDMQFVQIVGVTSDELQAAQHWNGLGLINLLRQSRACGPWLLTDMRRARSIMEEDPSVALRVREGIDREGSNLSGVSAKCWWMPIYDDDDDDDAALYRDNKDESDEEDEFDEEDEAQDADVKPSVKSERLSPSREQDLAVPMEEPRDPKYPRGLHITFNREAGSLLPLAIRGRVMHGRHFTFKSVISRAAITMVASSVTNAMVTVDKPYAIQGPWLQALIPDELAQKMAPELQVLNEPQQLELPKTFSWPEYQLSISIVND